MSTSKEFIEFILEQFSDLEDVSARMMMGEWIIYYRGKITAYVCDNRFLVKPVESARKLLPNAKFEPPYKGAKEMILIEDLDDREFLTDLFKAMYDELPERKKK